jgi:HEAT repeat protein
MMSESNQAASPERSTLASRLRDVEHGIRLAAMAECLMVDVLPEGVAAALAEGLEDPDPGIRILAVEALPRCGGEAGPPLISALHVDQPMAVRGAAASALARMSPPAVEAAVPLAGCLESEDEVLRWHAGAALGRLGEAAVPCLRPLIFAPGETAMLAALKVLAGIGAEASDALDDLQALDESQPPSRVALACAAAQAGITGDSARFLPILGMHLAGEDPRLREASLQHLADLGEAAMPLLEAITGALEDPHAPVRAAAVVTLARIVVDPAQAVPLLIQRLDDSEADVRGAAIMALAHLGPRAGAALARIRELQGTGEGPLQSMARAAEQRIDVGHA